jgi:hypothetical protein
MVGIKAIRSLTYHLLTPPAHFPARHSRYSVALDITWKRIMAHRHFWQIPSFPGHRILSILIVLQFLLPSPTPPSWVSPLLHTFIPTVGIDIVISRPIKASQCAINLFFECRMRTGGWTLFVQPEKSFQTYNYLDFIHS